MALKGDFIGFTFNGIHSSAMGIAHISNGSRYSESLLPASSDRTQNVPGGDGTYYFGSEYTQRQFNVDFATDELSEVQFRQLRAWLGDRGIHELIFDEAPYKVWSVKCTGTPSFNFICFKEGPNNRTYKGEGQITFTAYYPFARCYDKSFSDYSEFSNCSEWQAASGLLENDPTSAAMGSSFDLYNPGDISAPFKFFVPFTSGSIPSFTLAVTSGEALQFSDMAAAASDSGICIDTKSNLVSGYVGTVSSYELTSNLYNRYKTAGTFFKIPVVTSSSELDLTSGQSGYLRYDYLYL